MFSEKNSSLSFCSLKYISVPTSVSNFNSKCFLRGRCFMEVWCPVWEARSRPRYQGPQRKCAGYLSTTSWKLKLSGRRKKQGDRKDGDEEKSSEWRSPFNERNTQREDNMEHARENGMSADLSQCSVRYHLNKEKQSRDADTNNKEETPKKKNKLSCGFNPQRPRVIGRCTREFPHASGHSTCCWACLSVVPRYQFHLMSMHQTYSLLTCTRIPCRDSHCENGRVRCCIYILTTLGWDHLLGREHDSTPQSGVGGSSHVKTEPLQFGFLLLLLNGQLL